MSEAITEFSEQLVIGRKVDGRRRYAPEAKRKLVEAALQPDVSVARLALDNGLNANLLRAWITRYNKERAGAISPPTSASHPAFVSVIAAKPAPPQSAQQLRARLPNGVEIDLSDASGDAVASLLQVLSALPCSNSTKA